jgi:sigma-B regulation protein RsbU (phosphoserine phosphatase)
MITAVLKDLIAKDAKDWANPRRFLTYLNKEMYSFFASANSDHYVTAFYCVFNLQQGSVVYSNAGHPAPIFLGDEGIARLDCSDGLPLGLFLSESYKDAKRTFLIGNQVFMFTDGLFDFKNSRGEFFKEDLLIKELVNNRDIFAYLREAITSSKKTPLNDDINIIKIKRTDTKESGG